PVLGRFISPDPLVQTADSVTANAYCYADNDPVGKTDPSGMSTHHHRRHHRPPTWFSRALKQASKGHTRRALKIARHHHASKAGKNFLRAMSHAKHVFDKDNWDSHRHGHTIHDGLWRSAMRRVERTARALGVRGKQLHSLIDDHGDLHQQLWPSAKGVWGT